MVIPIGVTDVPHSSSRVASKEEPMQLATGEASPKPKSFKALEAESIPLATLPRPSKRFKWLTKGLVLGP